MFNFKTNRKTHPTYAPTNTAKNLFICPYLYKNKETEQVYYVARNTTSQTAVCDHAARGIPLTNVDLRHPITGQLLCCINCGHELLPNAIPIPIPESYDPQTKKFKIRNVFAHTFGCAARYFLSRNIFTTSTQYAVLCLMARELYHVHAIQPASEVTELQKYGGPLTLEEYLGDVNVVAPVSDRLVPQFVVSQLRIPPQQSATAVPAGFVADSSREIWSCAGLTRGTAGPLPHVPLQPAQPTPFDHFLDLVQSGALPVPAPPPPKPTKARKPTVSRKQRLASSAAAVLQATAPTVQTPPLLPPALPPAKKKKKKGDTAMVVAAPPAKKTRRPRQKKIQQPPAPLPPVVAYPAYRVSTPTLPSPPSELHNTSRKRKRCHAIPPLGNTPLDL
jgi:hypothetical protein